MKLLRILAITALTLECMCSAPVPAQSQTLVVGSCGTLPVAYVANQTGRPVTVDVNGNTCVSASVSASITGFAPANTGTPISVTTGGVAGTLPAGAVVVAFNTGTTNTAFCKLGATATTNDIAIPPASWFSYTVGGATQLTCITSTSTTTVNMVGGTGLPTGAGGGGGGGSAAGTTSNASSAVATSSTNQASVAYGYGFNGTTWDQLQVDGSKRLIVTDPLLITAVQAPIAVGTNYIGQTGLSALYSGSQSTVIGCDKSSVYDASTSGKTTVVTGTAAKKTYVCGYQIRTGGTATNVSLGFGTGAACVTTYVVATPAFQLAANDAQGEAHDFWNGFGSGQSAADNLCVNTSAANPVQVYISWTQQ